MLELASESRLSETPYCSCPGNALSSAYGRDFDVSSCHLYPAPCRAAVFHLDSLVHPCSAMSLESSALIAVFDLVSTLIRVRLRA